MTEDVKTTTETQSIVDEIKDAVKDAIKTESSKTIEDIINSIKEKLTANGVEFTEQLKQLVTEAVTAIMRETGESISTKVDSFMESKKDQWAQLALQDPDEARRKLRTFWMGISGVCLVVGLVVGIWVF
mgnify:CR=1 FL=1